MISYVSTGRNVQCVRVGMKGGVCLLKYCTEKMLLHKWTMQDKDFYIIIIKSEQPHMVREKSCTKTIKLKASQRTEIHEILIFSARRTDKV